MSKKPAIWLKKFWKFIWNDNSIWSWIFNALLAFILIKFLVYPGLGFVLHTSHPVVAVISQSMEYKEDFDEWWEVMGTYYQRQNITYEEFKSFTLSNGFNKGDIIIARGKEPQEIQVGDVIVFKVNGPVPIIHRVVKKWEADKYYFSTKGDMNPGQLQTEAVIEQDRVIGTAWIRVPYVGNIRIIFTEMIEGIKSAVRGN